MEALELNDACKKFLSVISKYVDFLGPEKSATIPPHNIIKSLSKSVKVQKHITKLYRKYKDRYQIAIRTSSIQIEIIPIMKLKDWRVLLC